jgi:hypothetical protein
MDTEGHNDMTQSRPTIWNSEFDSVDTARSRWLAASEHASSLAAKLFQPGSGYGEPDARQQDEHRLQSARDEAERLFREYQDLDRRDIDFKMFKLQRSQQLATWASFSVALVVGIATVANTVVALLK